MLSFISMINSSNTLNRQVMALTEPIPVLGILSPINHLGQVVTQMILHRRMVVSRAVFLPILFPELIQLEYLLGEHIMGHFLLHQVLSILGMFNIIAKIRGDLPALEL